MLLMMLAGALNNSRLRVSVQPCVSLCVRHLLFGDRFCQIEEALVAVLPSAMHNRPWLVMGELVDPGVKVIGMVFRKEGIGPGKTVGKTGRLLSTGASRRTTEICCQAVKWAITSLMDQLAGKGWAVISSSHMPASSFCQLSNTALTLERSSCLSVMIGFPTPAGFLLQRWLPENRAYGLRLDLSFQHQG
jgi:hypothetical protein